jgi:two-component system response regulator HydG
LDEIGETPGTIQVKLLRMLQEREIYPVGSSSSIPVDVRVIAATNRDLEQEVARGHFRTDLYYRLNVIPLNLPSLRERLDDIPLLIDHFLRQGTPEYKGNLTSFVEESALRALQAYDWPGNVRELENVIERASIIRDGDCLTLRDLPDAIRQPSGEPAPSNMVGGMVSLEELERVHILKVLEMVGGHKKRAADILQINPSTLYRKLLRYGVGGKDDEEELEIVSEFEAARQEIEEPLSV